MKPSISVVIPTRNRAARVRATILALAKQSARAESYEVVVVADGCTDDTSRELRSLRLPFHLTVLEQQGSGRAAARNAGAAAAAAEIVLFLDDDMEADPGLIAAHLAAHRDAPGGVVVGYFPLANPGSHATIFERAVCGWWDEFFRGIAEPDHRFTYRDFCTGNVSLPRETFHAAGGFDRSVSKGAGEDWELGLRLLERGVSFRFAPAAKAIHCDQPSRDGALRRAREEGYGHAVLARRHREFFNEFNLSRLSRLQWSTRLRWLWRLTWRWPAMVAGASLLLKPAHRAAEAMKLYNLMWRIHGVLSGCAYWRGVHAALGSLQAWEELRAQALPGPADPHEIRIDLGEAPAALVRLLDTARPDAVRITYRDQPVGRIEARVGAEPLRWVHVRTALLRDFPWALQWILVEQLAEKNFERAARAS